MQAALGAAAGGAVDAPDRRRAALNKLTMPWREMGRKRTGADDQTPAAS